MYLFLKIWFTLTRLPWCTFSLQPGRLSLWYFHIQKCENSVHLIWQVEQSCTVFTFVFPVCNSMCRILFLLYSRKIIEKDFCTYCQKPMLSDVRMIVEDLNIHCHASCFKVGLLLWIIICNFPVGTTVTCVSATVWDV